jgi:hypothetical protein
MNLKRDPNDILREEGPEALRASFDEAATRSHRKPNGAHAEGQTTSVIKSSAEFVAGFEPPNHLIDGLAQRRFCYSLTGPTGSGKTAVSLLLSAHVALPLPIGGREVEQGRVLYFAGENPDDVRMRWIAMAEHMGFDLNNIDVHFVPGAFKIEELDKCIRQEIDTLGGVALVIIDTSAAYFGGDSENDNVQMGAHARQLRNLTTLPGGPCVVVNCHPAKNASADNLLPRGGGAFVAEVDGNLVCVKSDETVSLHWQGKFRGPDFEPIPFETRAVTAARLKDSKGRSIFTVIAKPLTETEQHERAAGARTDEDAVLIALAENDTLSIAGLASSLDWLTSKGTPHKSKVWRVLERLRVDKLVAKERGAVTLTEKGKAAAKKAGYNRAAAGASYG